ncbi:MAG: hypothetical protein Kow00124_24960 [Anaerolineae bacterium]
MDRTDPTPIAIPDFALVLLIGPAGAGKSTFAARHFALDEVIATDALRGQIAGDEADQSVNAEVFRVLHEQVEERLRARRLTVVDATNVLAHVRKPLVDLAARYHAPAVALVLAPPLETCLAQNAARPGRVVPAEAVRWQHANLRAALLTLHSEPFTAIHAFTSPEEIAAARLTRMPLPADLRDQHGPFDIIGDVHGCLDELVELLGLLGCRIEGDPAAPDAGEVIPPPGRTVVFLGDYVDRGPAPVGVLRLVMGMHAAGTAICVQGNHDVKLARALEGRQVRQIHGLRETLAALQEEPQAFREAVRAFIRGLNPHYALDDERLVVAHAGMLPQYQMRESRAVRAFALYGDTTGRYDEHGLPIRRNWALTYSGASRVAYGHTPVTHAVWINNTINLDTGCSFGNLLSALRWPEDEIVTVRARRTYFAPLRGPFPPDWQIPEG